MEAEWIEIIVGAKDARVARRISILEWKQAFFPLAGYAIRELIDRLDDIPEEKE